MKYSINILAVAALASALAGYDRRGHAQFHQHVVREVETVIVKNVAIKYVFEGQEVAHADVCHGLADGTFVWDPNTPDKPVCDVNAPIPSPTSISTAATTPTPSPAALLQEAPSPISKAKPTVNNNNNLQVHSNYLSLLASNPGVNEDFPDGVLPCTFESLQKYGAVPLNYLGRGGFTAIVSAKIDNGAVSGLSGNLASGGDGNYFSYACPAGYMKAQWPAQSSGQTVGGVVCSNGVFRLTNPASTKLCTAGAGGVTTINKVGQVISVCNTDYPATEDETVPTRIAPGGSAKLAITDSGSYFKHIGSMTSAQYYLNPAGYDIQEACKWGTNDGRGIGNWAPVNLGLGTDANGSMVYVGLFSAEQVLHDSASPSKIVLLNYNVKIEGSGQTCEYRNENGKGVFYMNGNSKGFMGQTFDGQSVPGVTVSSSLQMSPIVVLR